MVWHFALTVSCESEAFEPVFVASGAAGASAFDGAGDGDDAAELSAGTIGSWSPAAWLGDLSGVLLGSSAESAACAIG